MRESVYQRKLIDTLKKRFPGCMVLKNDSGYIQGIPDLLLLYQNHWVALEVKAKADSAVQPNQQYYVDKMGEMSQAYFIHPDNQEEVLDEIQQSFIS